MFLIAFYPMGVFFLDGGGGGGGGAGATPFFVGFFYWNLASTECTVFELLE